MPDFSGTRAALASAQQQRSAAAAELAEARAALARAKSARRTAERGGDAQALAQSDAALAAQQDKASTLQGKFDAARLSVTDHRDLFAIFTDPRDRIGELSDQIPILLLPLRVETRFKRDPGGDGSGALWVRAYPDDIAIDSFESIPSESEIRQVEAYWTAMWRAGGEVVEHRGAWRMLLGSQGSGRAFWLTQTYRPLNEAEIPVADPATPAVRLVFATRVPLADPELAAMRAFWEALWRAGTDPAAQQSAIDDLATTLGAARAAELQASHAPVNLSDVPPAGSDRATAQVSVHQLVFPDADAIVARAGGWSQAPHVRVMPDRLVLTGTVGDQVTLEMLGEPIPPTLQTGPDPSAPEAAQTQRDGDAIKFEDEIAWLADFDAAVALGMGFVVPLNPLEFRRGFDTLMVLGVRLAADEATGQAELEQLFEHHAHGRSGLSILPQGRPTNNVEGEGAAYSWREDSDVSFAHYFGGEAVVDSLAWKERSDGRWLASSLGVKPEALQAVPFAGHHDAAEAMAMNTALWPATLGYFMDAMMDPVFEPETVEKTRDFFTHYITARGTIPAIRVGKQPYGILPATPRSRMDWLKPGEKPATGLFAVPDPFELQLYRLIRKVEADWSSQLDKVAYVGKAGDAHQTLLDVVGLHPGSVEFYQRYAEGVQHLYNRARLSLFGADFWAAVAEYFYVEGGLDLLASLGWNRGRAEVPEILEKLFLDQPNLLKGHLIDDRPLSEAEAIRAYTTGGANYLDWLIEAAGTSHDALRAQKGFTDNKRPKALLYQMMRHALDLSFVEVSRRLFVSAGLLDPGDMRALRRDAAFIQVRQSDPQAAVAAIGSRWDHLYRAEASITGNPALRVGDFIPTVITTSVATAYLNEQLGALKRLAARPTAALERLFVEHLDLCSYRLDAWYGGLMRLQLSTMRGDRPGGDDPPRQGIYLGAFGWIEELKPDNRQVEPVKLDPVLDEIFNQPGDPALERDSRNAGYIHTPSLNHAVTAAILRNGYLSNAAPANPGSLAVNLSSERVRMALGVIEGMREEQSLGALLGYQFERGLHDRHDVEVDAFIYDLRKAFPLAGNRLLATKVGAADELGRKLTAKDVEARNVIDGLALIEQMRKGGSVYPFGVTGLPPASAAQSGAIGDEAKRIANIADAVADIAMAESVHQVAQGNYDRGGATLDSYSKGKFPEIPDVVTTPRSGVTLNLRVGLHLDAAIAPADPANITPRAMAEPSLNAWLGEVLPPAALVACQVTVVDDIDATTSAPVPVTLADLALSPIDLLYALDTDGQQAMRAIDDAIVTHVRTVSPQRASTRIEIDYRSRIPALPGHVPFFELAALVRSLRSVVLRSRPLRATDMSLANDAKAEDEAGASLEIARASLPQGALGAARDAMAALAAAIRADIATGIDDVIANIDANMLTFSQLAGRIATFAHPEFGSGAAIDERRRIFVRVHGLLAEKLVSWDEKLAGFDAALAAYDADIPADEDTQFIALHRAETHVLAAISVRLPAMTPAAFRTQLGTTTRAAFVGQQGALDTLRDTAQGLSDLLTALGAASAGIAVHDATALALDTEHQAVATLASDLAARGEAIVAACDAQLTVVTAAIQAHGDAASDKDRLAAVTGALKALFGDDFLAVPRFSLSSAQAAEWTSAWGGGATASTAILSYLETEKLRAFPVDDWAAGVARVREKMRHFERVSTLGEALGGGTVELQPLQFPFRAEDYWLGLEFPKLRADGTTPFAIDEDKLLYTGHFATPFAAGAVQAGLLIDDWTEVIPARTEDTGLTFQYDRPNTEPPQTLLLAMPSRFTGAWQWTDLVDTVRETMDLAKRRAIEPTQIDTTAYSRFLPAIVSATTLHPITASLNFAFNNDLAASLTAATGGDDE